MDEKSNELINCLGILYKTSIVKNNVELQKIIAECVKPLMGNNDDKVYFEVVAKLSHGIINYYETSRENVPKEIKDIYKQIEKDVPAKSVAGKRLRRQLKNDNLTAIF